MADASILSVLNGCGLDAGTVTGGPVRFHEVSRRWQRREGVRQRLLTTSGGEEMLRRMGCTMPAARVRASLAGRRERFRAGRLWSYALSALDAPRALRGLDAPDAVLTVSDYFCDVVPAGAVRRRWPAARWIAWIHHREEPPAARPGNPLGNRVTWALQQWSFRRIARGADEAWVLDSGAGEAVSAALLGLGMPAARIRRMWNGLDLEAIRAAPAQAPDTDAVLVGVRANKGMHDIVPVWEEVLRLRPGTRLRLMGGMSGEGPVLAEIARRGLDRFIEVSRSQGYLAPAAYYAALKRARVFFAPSHEEGWGIALGEAMACGLPVAAYDLPAYRRVFGDSHAAVPCFDRAALARALVRLLDDPAEHAARAAAGQACVARYGWDAIAEGDWQAATVRQPAS
jgi:glycosyltransferase involved in cell wall biosynthesis